MASVKIAKEKLINKNIIRSIKISLRIKKRLTIKCFAGRKCPWCGSRHVIDNGDTWLCMDCNHKWED